MHLKNSYRLFFGICSLILPLYGVPFGISGGYLGSTSEPWAVFVEENGNTENISGSAIFSISGPLSSIDINNHGVGLVGGTTGSPTTDYIYSAFVYPDGSVVPNIYSNFPVEGTISSVSINDSGKGAIAGVDTLNNTQYLAFVQSGVVSEILGPNSTVVTGGFNSIQMNASGNAMVGGQINSNPYLALVNQTGNVQNISSGSFFSQSSASIISVAYNGANQGIAGGGSGLNMYLFLVNSSGILTELVGTSNPVQGRMLTVALNDTNEGLAGGYTNTNAPYLLRTSQGQGTQVTFPMATGRIYSVDINPSGVGIVGGADLVNGIGYAAFIAPNGTLTDILSSSAYTGTIRDVAINAAGVGLICGTDGSAPYLSVAAPNGTVTVLIDSSIGAGELFAVSMPYSANPNIDAFIPASIGSMNSVFNGNLAAIYGLNHYLMRQEPIRSLNKNTNLEVSLLAANSPSAQVSRQLEDVCVWGQVFGNYVNQSAQGVNPYIHDAVVGGLVGVDYTHPKGIFGGGFSYGYTSYEQDAIVGNGSINEELFFLYATLNEDWLKLQAAFWFGPYQICNRRYTAGIIESKSHANGFLIDPHFDISYSWKVDEVYARRVEPFFGLDFINSWQGKYTETGSSGLNLEVPNFYASLLRLEVGSRLNQTWNFSQANLIFQEQLSYVNQKPFHMGSVPTSFVASISTFPVTIGSNRVQNLGSALLQAVLVPNHCYYPTIALDLRGEWGTYYQSYFIGLELSKIF